jgi:hypothetical protein
MWLLASPSLRRPSAGSPSGSVFAAGPEEAAFCPVMSSPSLTTLPPVRHLREDGTQSQHVIFDKEWRNFSEPHLFLLAVGGAGNFLGFNQKLASVVLT